MDGAQTGSAGREINLAVIAGDGIGREIVPAALEVLDRVGQSHQVNFRYHEFNLGARRYHATGEILPDAELASICEQDAIVLGAVGDPSVPSGVLERGLLLRLRFALDHYVNLRPAQSYPGLASPLAHPEGIDFVVVREGTEGLYCGNGGTVRAGTPQEIATEVSVNTAFGVERVARYAFAVAARRRKRLTLVHKDNVLTHAGGLWRRITRAVAEEYPQVETDYLHVDAATIFLVTDPQRFDVILTDNLFGDILTDQAGAITGGIGLAASGNINPEGKFPSMFEPVHGSAPDIAGQGKADPTATITSLALLCDHLELPAAAHEIRAAVSADMAARAAAAGSGGSILRRRTEEIAADIAGRIGKN